MSDKRCNICGEVITDIMNEDRFYIKYERTLVDTLTEEAYLFSWKSDAKEVCKILNQLQQQVEAQILVIKGYQERNDNLFKENMILKKGVEKVE